MWLFILSILGFASANTPEQYANYQVIETAGASVVNSASESSVVTRLLKVNGILTFDGHACIFRDGEVRIRGTPLVIGESGDFYVETGFANLVTGERVHIDGGLINVRFLPSTSVQPISNSLARVGLTLDQFIQQTGTLPPQQGIADINAGVISFDGTLRNVIAGVLVVLSEEVVKPIGTGGIPGFTSSEVARLLAVNGIVTFDRHACIFRNGEVQVRGTPLSIGESGEFDVEAGFATLGSGERVIIDGGLISVRFLSSTNPQPVSNSLARAGLTLVEFIRQTGTIPPQQGIIDITSGVLSINGNLKNVIAGVLVVVSAEFLEPTGPGGVQPSVNPAIGGAGVRPVVNSAIGETRTITTTVTETAAHETETVTEPVTLTKTQTQDEIVTITSPVYNSIAATIVNIVKQTVTVPEEQVIRSPVAGSIVVNTIPVATQTVLTVSVRSTNMFVRTVHDEVTKEHTHFITNYSISTATVNIPATSTVVQVITQTGVSTVTNTSTVGKTVYATTTLTVNIGNTGPGAGGYY